jgi:hypothetical protein
LRSFGEEYLSSAGGADPVETAFARRDFDAAFRFCAALVEAHPAHFAGWFNCGVALQKVSLYEKAADAF